MRIILFSLLASILFSCSNHPSSINHSFCEHLKMRSETDNSILEKNLIAYQYGFCYESK